MSEHVDIAVVGAGAAGLMAGIFAGRTAPSARVVVVDGAKTIGAKILVAGGGRCNVTHESVDASAFAGASRNAIGKVLRHFDVPDTIAFFRDLGVELKREETGKLFPTTDKARTVLDALLGALSDVGVTLRHPFRVETVERTDAGFAVEGPQGRLEAGCVVLATGGKSLPKSGSDGHGYEISRSLGHTVTPRVFPALVPLLLPEGHFVRELSGITLPARLAVVGPTGRELVSFTNSTLCTHFGLSGPSALDISRYLLDAQADDAGAQLRVSWLPGEDEGSIDSWLREARSVTLEQHLSTRLPQRMATALCAQAGLEPGATGDQLTRRRRKALGRALVSMALPVAGQRGWAFAEVTAGGVPLDELDLRTMSSRVCPGLYLCGEILDVDGRIGGFNFQWAWASGHTVGVAVGRRRLE